jgi:hypothetical protein
LNAEHAEQPFDLLPGDNAIAAQFRYQPANTNDTIAQVRFFGSGLFRVDVSMQEFLSEFISSAGVPITINGGASSTPFASLQPALSAISLDSAVPGRLTSVWPISFSPIAFSRVKRWPHQRYQSDAIVGDTSHEQGLGRNHGQSVPHAREINNSDTGLNAAL